MLSERLAPQKTLEITADLGWEILPHAAYSPDFLF